MDQFADFVHRKNVEHYRKLPAETKNEAQHQLLLHLLNDEEAKNQPSSPPRHYVKVRI